MIKSVAISSFVGLLAAGAAWAATVMIVGNDGTVLVQDQVVEWPTAIGVLTATMVIGVLIALHRVIEPMLTAVATAAGCALLYNTRELPFDQQANLSRSADNYWVVIVAMVMIFAVLLIGLRVNRSNG